MADPSTNTEMVRVPILGENGRISDDYVPQEIPDSVATVTQKAAEAAQSASDASASASAASGSAEAAATSETNAADSAKGASDAATDAANQATAAKGHSDTAKSYSDSASQSALAASGYVTSAAQSASDAASSASAAQTSATQAATSASGASASATAADASARAAKASESAAGSSAKQAATSATQASSSAEAAAGSAQTATEKADSVLDHYIESAQATTLEPGSQATASVADKILTIGVPKGEKGDTGLGIPEGGSAGQVVKKTADGAEWAYDTGAVYNSEEGLQEMAEDGTNDPIYNFGITQGGMSSSMSVMGDSPEVATSYTSASTNYKNAIGVDANGPYVDLNLSGKTGEATKYRYVDDVNDMPSTDGIPTAKATYAAAKGNVLSGTKSGVIVSADDAYPAKPRRLTVYGATRQNLWVNPTIDNSADGMTLTANANGSVTVGGTTTDDNVYYRTGAVYVLRPGSMYTLSVTPVPDDLRFMINPEDDGIQGASVAWVGMSHGGSVTFQCPSGHDAFRCLCYVPTAGTSLSGTYRVMLNEGSEPEPWCPPGLNSVDELSIVTAGKNLWRNPSSSTNNGVTFTSNDDGSFTLKGSLSAASPDGTYFRTSMAAPPPGSRVTLSVDSALSENYVRIILQFVSYENDFLGGNNYVGFGDTLSKTMVVPLGTDHISLGVYVISSAPVGTVTAGTYHPQLEVGPKATEWVSPASITTTPIDLDGHSLCSLPDGTCDELIIEADGSASIVKRVHEQEFTANDFTINTINNSQAPLSADTSLDVSFLPSQQMNDFAPVANADSVNYLVAGVFNSAGFQRFCVGKIGMGTDSKDCLAKVKSTIGSATIKALYPLATPETISLPSVTLPTLPSPNITVYHDSDVPSNITVEYERDVTIAFEQLEAKVSELTVNQATN